MYKDSEVKAEVKKWGNSLAVRIPKQMLDNLGLHDGSQISLSVSEDNIILHKLENDDKKKQLLNKMQKIKRIKNKKSISEILSNDRDNRLSGLIKR